MFKTDSLFGVVWIIFSIFTGVMSVAKLLDDFVYWKGFMEQLLLIYTSAFYWIPWSLFNIFNIDLPKYVSDYYAVGFLFSLSMFELFRIRAAREERKEIVSLYNKVKVDVEKQFLFKDDEEIDRVAKRRFRQNFSEQFPATNGSTIIKLTSVPIIALLWPLFLFALLPKSDGEGEYFGIMIFYKYLFLYIFILGSIMLSFDVSDYKGTA